MRDKKTRRNVRGSVPIKFQRRNYLYWYKFLQFALKHEKVNWSKYKKWNISKEKLINNKYDVWWKYGQLLVHPDNTIIDLSTTHPKPNAYKLCFKVLELKHQGLTHPQIVERLNNYKSPKGTVGYYLADAKASGAVLINARKIMRNVCKGMFP